MDERRLSQLLSGFPRVRVLVVGDFFLDKYLILDRRLSEVSLETGLEAYQVVEVRPSPGAAGTVTANLRALGVRVTALSVIGDDGEGYELKRGLRSLNVDIDHLIEQPDRHTPTYTKPIMREPDGHEHELNRMDIKNRTPLPRELEDEIIAHLRDLVPHVDGLAIVDQVQERNCGVVTDRVREELTRLAREYPEKIFIADSRERIGLFRDVILKPNRREAALAVGGDPERKAVRDEVRHWGEELQRRSGRPVFITAAEEGIYLFTAEGFQHVPAVPVEGPIDPVGAGDSVTAGLLASLCTGASLVEAATLANLVAAVTIRQLGTTGTASPDQVLAQFRALRDRTGLGS